MQTNIYGLKCDALTCDYVDDTITLDQYESYINYPCPSCGSPLLTENDYKTLQVILSVVKEQQAIAETQTSSQQAKIRVELDGTGVPKVDVTLIEE